MVWCGVAAVVCVRGASYPTRKTLCFQFYLPPAELMAELRPLMGLVFAVTQAVGQLRLSDRVRSVSRRDCWHRRICGLDVALHGS